MTTLSDALDTWNTPEQMALTRRWAYYAGRQDRVWVTDKFANLFRDLADSMGDNYCSLAVNTRVSRLEVESWTGTDEEQAQAVWDDLRWPTRQSNYYRWGLAYGKVYLVAEEGDDGPVLAPNRPTLMGHTAASDDPQRVESAVKAWYASGQWHANLYDESDVQRYVAPGKPEKMPKATAFTPDPEDEGGSHGFDTCPVIVCYPYGYDAPVLLDTVRGAQDRINKIGSNKFVAAEFSAYAQRVFFTRQDIQDSDVVNAPDRAIVLDPGDADWSASVTELAGGDLAKFDDAKQAEIDSFFTLSLLPRHLMVNPGADPSGEAIKADEGPLISAVQHHQIEFGEALVDGYAVLGIEAEPVWKDPVPRNELATATEAKVYADMGVPWQGAVRKIAGWTQEEIDEAVPAAPEPAVPAAPGVTNPLPSIIDLAAGL